MTAVASSSGAAMCPEPATEEAPQPKKIKQVPRKILARGFGVRDLDLDRMHPCALDEFKEVATLAMKDHFIRKSLDWKGWRVTKIEKVLRGINASQYSDCLTFEAQKKWQRKGHKKQQPMTFEAHLRSNASHRSVRSVRTLSPTETEWERGYLWVPLT